MTLQKRLFVFFIAIVGLPLIVAVLFAAPLVVKQLKERAFDNLRAARNQVAIVYATREGLSQSQLDNITLQQAFQDALIKKNYPAVQEFLVTKINEPTDVLDFVVVSDPGGAVLAQAFQPPSFLKGVQAPNAEMIARDDMSSSTRLLIFRKVIPFQAPNSKQPDWNIIGGFFLDSDVVEGTGAGLAGVAPEQVPKTTILIDSKPVASNVKGLNPAQVLLPKDLGLVDSFEADFAGEPTLAVVGRLYTDRSLAEASFVTSLPAEETIGLASALQSGGIVLVVLAVLALGLLGAYLARRVSQPLMRVSDAANAIAAGDYDQKIQVTSSDEVGMLARAFNDMSAKLKVHIAELNESRENLKRAYTRFGETLRSTHDLDRILEASLEAAMDSVGAERGMLQMVEGGRSLSVKAWRGVEAHEFDLPIGKGIAGWVVERETPVRIPGDGEQPTPHLTEPDARTIMAAPLYAAEKVAAVVSVYDKRGGDFTEQDMSTLLSLADQAGVAIENVVLHREAQHLAITDVQIGIPNNRYFTMQLDQEIQRSSRFSKSFAMIMLDIDDFKLFNDKYGHQVGDFVLIELATRVKSVIRDIDFFARYGGEEFTVLLPETDAAGGVRTGERIRAAIAEAPFIGELAPDPFNVRVTVGVAAFPLHARTGQTLIRAADLALISAKRRGKNQVLLYEPGLEL